MDKRVWAVLGVTLVLIALFGFLAARGVVHAAGAVIAAALVVLLFVSRQRLEERWFLAALAAVFALGVHLAFGPEWSVLGVTHDVFLHLIGGFVAAALALAVLERSEHALVYAVLAALVLGFGVELVEFLFEASSLPVVCADHFCPYWQDTVKDLVMDLVGALAFVGIKRFS